MTPRWRFTILICLLCLGLTHCAPRQIYNSLFQSGFVYCSGPIGQFQVVLSQDTTNTFSYDLIIQPITIPQPGNLVEIALGNDNNQYRFLVQSTTLQQGQSITASTSLSQDDVQLYPTLIIVPYNGNSDPTFLANSAQNGVVCSLPTTDSSTGASL